MRVLGDVHSEDACDAHVKLRTDTSPFQATWPYVIPALLSGVMTPDVLDFRPSCRKSHGARTDGWQDAVHPTDFGR